MYISEDTHAFDSFLSSAERRGFRLSLLTLNWSLCCFKMSPRIFLILVKFFFFFTLYLMTSRLNFISGALSFYLRQWNACLSFFIFYYYNTLFLSDIIIYINIYNIYKSKMTPLCIVCLNRVTWYCVYIQLWFRGTLDVLRVRHSSGSWALHPNFLQTGKWMYEWVGEVTGLLIGTSYCCNTLCKFSYP